MNTNPIRVIATCEICLSDGSTRTASVGHDVPYDASASDIHEAITDEVYTSLVERDYRIASVVVTSICNLGQVPMPEKQLEFHKHITHGPFTKCLACGGEHTNPGLPCPLMTPMS